MRSRLQLSVILLVASSLVACDAATPPTEPAAKPDALIFSTSTGYGATLLPLIPAGISDSGVIAGTLGLDVARYYNGVLTPAQRDPVYGGSYEARGINNHGA